MVETPRESHFRYSENCLVGPIRITKLDLRCALWFLFLSLYLFLSLKWPSARER